MTEKTVKSEEYRAIVALKGFAVGSFALKAATGKHGAKNKTALRLARKESTLTRTITGAKSKELQLVSANTEFWHGTGRFQYSGGKKVDVLESMLKAGGITPQHDDIDIVGDMQSISLSRSRLYSRAYADMHQHGPCSERFGSSLFWAAAFIGPLGAKMAVGEKMWKKQNRDRVKAHFDSSNSANWSQKVRSEPTGTLGVFAMGSDIPGNYPVLFGIKTDSAEKSNTSEYIAIHETRASNQLGFGDLTHIEVPEANLQETKTMLDSFNVNIPLYAIEDFEAYAAAQDFNSLITS
jgi:hypothetical protein